MDPKQQESSSLKSQCHEPLRSLDKEGGVQAEKAFLHGILMKSIPLLFSLGLGLALASPAAGMASPAWERVSTGSTAQQVLLAQAVDQTGKVKWYDDSKGFGFITPDDGSKDVFVQFSVIQGNGFKTLTPGQRVKYDVESGDKGPKAANVRAI